MKKLIALLLSLALILSFPLTVSAEPLSTEQFPEGSPAAPESQTDGEPYYGSRPYQPTTRTDVSDLGYALEMTDDIDYYSVGIDQSQMYGMQIEEMQSYLLETLTPWMNQEIGHINWDEIDDYDSDVGLNYFKVFCQVGFVNSLDEEEDDTTFDYDDTFVWRWMYQTFDGNWAYKAYNRSYYYQASSNLGPVGIPWEYEEPPAESNNVCFYFQVRDTQDTDCDDWILNAVRDYTLMYLGDVDEDEGEVYDPLMPPIADAVNTALETNAGMAGDCHISLTKNELIQHLLSTKIFSCITHGDVTYIWASDGTLTITDINALSASAFDDLEFVYLGACLTGAGGPYANNLVNAFSDKGADVVLGFVSGMPIDELNFWTKELMVELSTGATLQEAMTAADAAVEICFDPIDDPTLNPGTYATSVIFRCLKGSSQIRPCG